VARIRRGHLRAQGTAGTHCPDRPAAASHGPRSGAILHAGRQEIDDEDGHGGDRPFKLDDVREALAERGVTGITVTK
jgi:hypothetical protein